MASMQDLEEHIKEAAADVIAKSFGTHQDDYLKYRNYQNKRKRKQRFSLPGILDTMKKTLDTDKEPIHYYMENHGTVPPWILFKSIYFSTITNFIDLLKENEQLALVAHLYPIDKFDITPSKLCKLMVDTLYICMDYKNTAAHGGRIYNFNSNRKINLEKVSSEKEREPFIGFSLLLFLLSLFEYQLPFSRLRSTLEHELTRHCNDFPQDVTYLGQIMNMNIVSTQYVYVTEKSNKYHFTPHCSGIKSPKRISFEEAVKSDYIPCKRCGN